MKKHTKVYLDAFAYTTGDFVPCEICMSKAVDIHHIKPRGMGGSKKSDTPDNLMALCRRCHEVFGDKKQFVEYLVKIHEKMLRKHGK